jgi:hypothetical protein
VEIGSPRVVPDAASKEESKSQVSRHNSFSTMAGIAGAIPGRQTLIWNGSLPA